MLSVTRMRRLERDLRSAEQRLAGGLDRDRSRDGRRATGAYFTPLPLVDFVVTEALAARFANDDIEWRDDGSPRLVVLDPAAGDARFLIRARELLVERAVERGFDAGGAAQAITRHCLIGIERDPDFAAAARSALGNGAVVHCREALMGAPGDLPAADVVIGNPPYQRSIHFAQTDQQLWQQLKGTLAATSYGEWDLYAAFLERALDWIGARGQVGLVVPSRWLTAAFAKKLREKLASAGAVRAVVDFGAEQLFEGATTYVSVVFLSGRRSEQVRVAKRAESQWRCGPVPTDELDSAPWRLTTGGKRTLLARLRGAAPALGDVARIAKGAGTNADRVFVFEQVSDDGELSQVFSTPLGETVEVDSALLRPCLRGRDVHGYGDVGSTRVLVPYTRDGELIAPQRMAAEFAHATAYLARCRDILERRERGRFRGNTYYCWGRPQNMAFLGSPATKLVVPDVARGGRALLDGSAAMVLDSAYALRLLDDASGYSLALLLAVLNSPMVGLWLSETGIPLRGNYLRMKTAYLRSLPLPPLSAATREIEAAVADDVDAEHIAELVRRAYAIDPGDWSA